MVGLLVYLDFLNVKVFAATFESGYFDFERLSRGPRRGGARVRAGPGKTGLGGDAGEIGNGGDGGFLEFMARAEWSGKGWGGGNAPLLVNETRQEIRKLLGRGFSARIKRGLGDA